jgi:hypothetical protein
MRYASTLAAITSLPPSFAMKLAAAHQPAGNVSRLQKCAFGRRVGRELTYPLISNDLEKSAERPAF